MISKELKGWLREIEPLTQVQELYLSTCQLTGSYVFGGYDPETSDRDVLVPPSINLGFFGYGYLAYKYGNYREEEFQSFYVKNQEGIVFNLLCFYTDEGFYKWKWATDQMYDERLSLGVDFSDKKFRVQAFEQYKKEWEKHYGR